MLSATSVETPPLELKSFAPTFDNVKLETLTGYFYNDVATRDGGFVRVNALDTLFVLPSQDVVTSAFTNGAGYTVSDGIGAFTELNVWHLLNSQSTPQPVRFDFDSSGLQPAVIEPMLDAGPIATANNGQVIGSTANTPPSRSEGGAIAIPQLLASLQQESLSSGAANLGRVAGARSVDGRLNVRTAAATSNVISGELARATSFEIVSAENNSRSHLGADSALQIENGDKPRNSKDSVSAAEDAHEEKQGNTPVAPQPGSRPVKASAPTGQTSQIDPSKQSASDGVEQGPVELAIDAIRAKVVGASEQFAGQNAHANGVLASDTAFADPGLLNAAAEPAGDHSLWSRSRVATPLVLMLALERIVAYNSRNSSRRLAEAGDEHNKRARFAS
jgi:hypothetical protein